MKQLFTKSAIRGTCLSLACISMFAQASGTPQPTPSPQKTIFGLPVEPRSSAAGVPGNKSVSEPADPRSTIPHPSEGASKGTVVAPPPRQSVHPSFPIAESQDDSFRGSGGYMHTDVHIFKNGDGSGSLNAVTHTWEVTELRGFRGAVAVALLDENKIPLWVSNTQNYGVDGVMIGTHDRTENWNEMVPAPFMPQIRYIAIIQKWNPKNEFDDIHRWVQGIGDAVGKAGQDIDQGVGKAAKGVGNGIGKTEKDIGQGVARELAAIIKSVTTIAD
jgi:hypothetical protein